MNILHDVGPRNSHCNSMEYLPAINCMARGSQACHGQTLRCLSRGGQKARRVLQSFKSSLQGEFRRHLETHSLDLILYFKWILCQKIHPRCSVCFFFYSCARLFGWLHRLWEMDFQVEKLKTMKSLCRPCFIERLHNKDRSGLTQSHSPKLSKNQH